MELGLLDTLVILIGVVEKLLLQLVWGVLLVDEVETFYLQEFGNSLADLPLVIINGVEGGAGWKNGGYHLQNYYKMVLMYYSNSVKQQYIKETN